MKQLENEIAVHIRTAISHLGKDQFLVGEQMRKAHELFSEHLMEWTDNFCQSYNKMLEIYRSYTPAKTGRYQSSHREIGYSSFQTRRWVEDKVQPPVPTVGELLEKFDALIASIA